MLKQKESITKSREIGIARAPALNTSPVGALKLRRRDPDFDNSGFLITGVGR
jgi:hypothetical protein